MVGLTPHQNNAIPNEDDDGTPGEVKIDRVRLTNMKINFSNEIASLAARLVHEGLPSTTVTKGVADVKVVEDLAVRAMIIDALMAVTCRQAILADMPLAALHHVLIQNYRAEDQRAKP